MPSDFLQKSLRILLQRQTNILSAAFVIMATVVFSQLLGLVRQRLLVSIFGASNTLGIYLASGRIPDLLFQIIIAGALSSAFIPVFSEFLAKNEQEKANRMASTLLLFAIGIFSIVSLILFIFAPFFLQLMNLGSGFSASDMSLMASLMRVIIFSQFLFIIATFFSALLQSYNHFFIPGIAAALYNLGVIIGILLFSQSLGIYAPAVGNVIGACFFILAQLPVVKKMGFSFIPILSARVAGVKEVLVLMWPRTVSLAIFQVGALLTVSLVSFLPDAGRHYVIFDYAQTLAFAPVALFGQTIAQAAFPVLSRERNNLNSFKSTFLTSFNQMVYLVLPVSVIFLVLRIPVVRLIFGAGQFDWDATVLTGRTLAFFAIGIFSQALIYLISRGFYALHDTKTPLWIGGVSTLFMMGLGYTLVTYGQWGVEGIAFAYSVAGILNVVVSMLFLGKKVNGFDRGSLLLPFSKIALATVFTGFALYIPIKLLDQLVFDTTKTMNLIFLTGISSAAGLSLYLFLTWLFNVKEAMTFILMFKRLGNWREILGIRSETIDPTRLNP